MPEVELVNRHGFKIRFELVEPLAMLVHSGRHVCGKFAGGLRVGIQLHERIRVSRECPIDGRAKARLREFLGGYAVRGASVEAHAGGLV